MGNSLACMPTDVDPGMAFVLVLSANAMPRDVEKGLTVGLYRYITKPIKVNEFLQALDEGLAMAGKAL